MCSSRLRLCVCSCTCRVLLVFSGTDIIYRKILSIIFSLLGYRFTKLNSIIFNQPNEMLLCVSVWRMVDVWNDVFFSHRRNPVLFIILTWYEEDDQKYMDRIDISVHNETSLLSSENSIRMINRWTRTFRRQIFRWFGGARRIRYKNCSFFVKVVGQTKLVIIGVDRE